MKSTLTVIAIYSLCLLQCPVAFTLPSKTQMTPPEKLAMAIDKCGHGDFKDATYDAPYIRCIVSALEVWSDDRGYDSAGVVNFLAEFQRPEEITVVVNYCNTLHRDSTNPHKWAFNAYKCATSGKIGEWLRNYATKLNTIE